MTERRDNPEVECGPDPFEDPIVWLRMGDPWGKYAQWLHDNLRDPGYAHWEPNFSLPARSDAIPPEDLTEKYDEIGRLLYSATHPPFAPNLLKDSFFPIETHEGVPPGTIFLNPYRP